MQPVRPKMKKVILTGFVACMSLFGLSSGAPVTRGTRPAEATAATLSPSAPSSTVSSTSASPSRHAGSNSRETRSASATAPSVAPSRPSSFSLGLSLGPIDYAAAGIARRVSRIFVKRMSAQSSQVHHVEEEQKAVDANTDTEETNTLVPVIESESSLDSEDPEQDPEQRDGAEAEATRGDVRVLDTDDIEHTNTENQDRDQTEVTSEETVSPELRACRWACF
ncbi:hypothetical protein BT96DRAFT_985472 [Gymnopus androsaceus JB14]|uniref:Uncharacterized protein n=1 Tax=Gymnopus androsaceus JB14 TaxID=1447944 RepID=A0A6A4I937_9AGAR|nr:hypothetical protein BT96DRAFT_985472 [Gymnopus androsaceus JB14]